MSAGKRTPLYDEHVRLGAKFVTFGGWEMPVQYSGVVEEHRAVRERVGLFDVSHMGELIVRGPGALSFLQYVTSNDVSILEIGAAQYSLLMREHGGVVDDVIIYRTGDEEYMICVNAGNIEKDYVYLREHILEADLTLRNLSPQFVQIAVQGPLAQEVVTDLVGADPETFSNEILKPFRFRICCEDWLVARTGYTGEDGFELFVPVAAGQTIWRDLVTLVEARDGRPCGLGARDTLRLEAAFPLYGHELSDDRNPIAANLRWVVKPAKGGFLGKGALVTAMGQGTSQRLTGFEVISPGIVREDAPIVTEDGVTVGISTSGTKTPSLEKPVFLAYVDASYVGGDEPLFAEVRGRRLEVRQTKLPFYRSLSK